MSIWSKISGLFKSSPVKEQETEESTDLQLIQEMLRNLQKRERRQAQNLERRLQELESKLDRIQDRMNASLPMEAVTSVTDSLATYYLRNYESDQALNHVWARYTALLKEMDIEPILDLKQKFDDTRHHACDTRHDPEHPENTVLELVRPGLVVAGRVTRPAVVVINRPPSHQDNTPDHHFQGPTYIETDVFR